MPEKTNRDASLLPRAESSPWRLGRHQDSFSYNNRPQPSAITDTPTNGTVLDLSYGYAAGDNGNIASLTDGDETGHRVRRDND